MKAYIVGAGGLGKHIAYNFSSYTDKYELVGFFDDQKNGVVCCGLSVVGPIESALHLKDTAIIIGIELPAVKKRIIQTLEQNDTLRFPELVHEKSWISPVVSIGVGTIIFPGVCIDYGSVIRNFCVISMNCSIGHHTRIGNYSFLENGVCIGNDWEIGESVQIGASTSLVHDTAIMDRASIRGGAKVNYKIHELTGDMFPPNVAS